MAVAAAAIVDELPAYASSGDAALLAEVREQVAQHIGAFTESVRAGSQPEGPALGFIGRTVDRRISQAIPAEQILDAYRVGHRVLWGAIAHESRQAGLGDDVLAALALAMVRYTEAAWAEVARSYIRAERRLEADLDRAQGRLVDALLAGRPADGIAGAGAFPQQEQTDYLVLVCSGIGQESEHALRDAARQLRSLSCARACVTQVRDEDLICVTALEPARGEGAGAAVSARLRAAAARLGCEPAIGVGLPARGPAEVPQSFREARAAARAAGRAGSLVLEECSIVARMTVLLEEGAVPTRVVPAGVQQFISGDPGRRGDLIMTVRRFAACDLNARRAAESLYVHRNTVLYRLQRVAELTGLNPQELPDLMDLIAAIGLFEGQGNVGSTAVDRHAVVAAQPACPV